MGLTFWALSDRFCSSKQIKPGTVWNISLCNGGLCRCHRQNANHKRNNRFLRLNGYFAVHGNVIVERARLNRRSQTPVNPWTPLFKTYTSSPKIVTLKDVLGIVAKRLQQREFTFNDDLLVAVAVVFAKTLYW